jgi:hypothetical protein
MANSRDFSKNREEQSTMNEAQENQRTQQVAENDEDNAVNSVNKPSSDYDDYPIRIHDEDIESVVGLGYD